MFTRAHTHKHTPLQTADGTAARGKVRERPVGCGAGSVESRAHLPPLHTHPTAGTGEVGRGGGGGITVLLIYLPLLYRENDLLKEQLKLMVQRRDSTLRPGDTMGKSLSHWQQH